MRERESQRERERERERESAKRNEKMIMKTLIGISKRLRDCRTLGML